MRFQHRSVRTTSVTAAVTLAASAGVFAWSGLAGAAVPDIYNLSAEAVAVQSTLTDPGVPLGLPFSVGSYGAGALLNSNGESSADAGAPYSPLVSSLPSTGNGVAQSTFGASLPVVPTFPGYVSARDPVLPLHKQNAGGYALTAIAEPGRSSGTVSIGGQAATSEENNAFAFANNLADTEGVFTEGAAGVHALTLGGILDLVNVSSYASLSRDGSGNTVPVTATNLGTISLAGLTSGLTGDGVTALGSAPTPISVDGIETLNEALKPAGISLTYLPETYAYTDGSASTGPQRDERKDVAGVVSGALQIRLTGTSERGTTTETITVGRISLTATSTSNPGTAGGVAGTDRAGADAAGLPATEASSPSVDAAALSPGGSDVTVGTPPTAAEVANNQLPVQTFVPTTANGAFREGTTSFESSFLLLAVAGAMALVAAQALRMLAIRGR